MTRDPARQQGANPSPRRRAAVAAAWLAPPVIAPVGWLAISQRVPVPAYPALDAHAWTTLGAASAVAVLSVAAAAIALPAAGLTLWSKSERVVRTSAITATVAAVVLSIGVFWIMGAFLLASEPGQIALLPAGPAWLTGTAATVALPVYVVERLSRSRQARHHEQAASHASTSRTVAPG